MTPALMPHDSSAVLAELVSLMEALEDDESFEDAVGVDVARLGSFKAKRRQRLCVGPIPRPLVAVILDGEKHVLDTGERARRGDVLFVPAQRPCNLINVPPSPSQPYRSFGLQVAPQVTAQLGARHPGLLDGPLPWAHPEPRVMAPSHATLLALLHFARSLGDPDAHVELLRHRLEDVLLSVLLAWRHGERQGATQAREDPILAVRHLVRRTPERAWRATEIATQLAMSEATLRRRLAEAKTSFRQLLLEERMRLARTLLADRSLSVSEVALRCGYQSPSKFAAQFERFSGASPSRFARPEPSVGAS